MSLPHCIVIEVMSRGNLDAAAAKLRVHIVIDNYGNAAAHQGQFYKLASQALVARVIRVHRDGSVAQHGFWPGGGYSKRVCTTGTLCAISKRITKVPEMAGLFFGDDF